MHLRSPLQYATARTKKPLLKLLQSFRPFQVSDPRDKIYSLLSHSSDLGGTGYDYTLFASGHTKPSLQIITSTTKQPLSSNIKLGVSGCLIDKTTWIGDQILPYY